MLWTVQHLLLLLQLLRLPRHLLHLEGRLELAATQVVLDGATSGEQLAAILEGPIVEDEEDCEEGEGEELLDPVVAGVEVPTLRPRQEVHLKGPNNASVLPLSRDNRETTGISLHLCGFLSPIELRCLDSCEWQI